MTNHHVNVNISECTYKTIEDLAERESTSMAEVLRDAIALKKRFQDTIEAGSKVLVMSNREKYIEIQEIKYRAYIDVLLIIVNTNERDRIQDHINIFRDTINIVKNMSDIEFNNCYPYELLKNVNN